MIDDFNDDFFDDEDGFEENFNDNEFPDDFSSEDKMKANEIFEKAIDGYVRFNYETIQMHGLDINATRQMVNLDPEAMVKLKATLEFMMNYFVKTEEYEKCSILRDYLEQI